MKIAIIGAGQLGSRHIQGALKVNSNIHIEVVEPSETSISLSKKRNQEVNTRNKITYHQNIKCLNGKYEVVIISTNSDVRLGVIKALFNEVEIKNLILEKVVFQSIEEFNHLDELLKSSATSVYVNHPRRMYDFYKKLKEELKENQETVSHIHISGNDWGLACNGLHFIDLSAYLMESEPNEISNQFIQKITSSKRKGFIEFIGHLWINYTNHSSLLISSLQGQNKATCIDIITPNSRYKIEEGGRAIISTFKKSKWISDTPIKTPFQSELTTILIEDILNNKKPQLTSLNLSKKCHYLFIESLKDAAFNIDKKVYSKLPIT